MPKLFDQLFISRTFIFYTLVEVALDTLKVTCDFTVVFFLYVANFPPVIPAGRLVPITVIGLCQ